MSLSAERGQFFFAQRAWYIPTVDARWLTDRMTRTHVTMNGKCGQINAIRRSLISKLTAIAPRDCLIKVNTSCQSDEYIAQRIGLVSFDQSGNADGTAHVSVRGRPCTTGDFTTPDGGPLPVDTNILIMPLTGDQEIDIVVYFDRGTGCDHARYGRIVAAGMETMDENTHILSYETVFGDPDECLAEALDALTQTLTDAKKHLLAMQ